MNITIIFGVVGIILFAFGGYMHEAAHQQIYRMNGIDSKIDMIHHFPDFVTIADEPCPNAECMLANANVEAFGYQIEAVFMLLIMGLMIIIGQLDAIISYKQHEDYLRMKQMETEK